MSADGPERSGASGLRSAEKMTCHPSVHWAPLATLSRLHQIQVTNVTYKVLNGTAPIYSNALAKTYVTTRSLRSSKGLSSSGAYTTHRIIQTLFMCCSTMVEWPTERYQNRAIPVYVQETLRSSSSESISYPSTYPVLPYPLYPYAVAWRAPPKNSDCTSRRCGP